MPLKINKRGFSLVELTISLFILITISSIAFLYLYPARQKRRANDVKRIANLQTLARAIEEYKVNNGSYPDSDNTTRTSNALPTGNAGPYESVTQGWIDSTFTGYIQKIPVDPKNTGSNVYTYRRSGGNYELNAVLEYDTTSMQNDKGNNNSKYEIGTSLTLMN
jgi:type II secretory pathway pseudopilin PulG